MLMITQKTRGFCQEKMVYLGGGPIVNSTSLF